MAVSRGMESAFRRWIPTRCMTSSHLPSAIRHRLVSQGAGAQVCDCTLFWSAGISSSSFRHLGGGGLSPKSIPAIW